MDIEKAEKAIRSAYIAGIISGVITLIVTLAAVGGVSIMGFDVWNFLDVFFIFGLAYGIYRKSRACAVTMFIYFIGNRLLLFSSLGLSAGGLFGAIIFGYFFLQGIRGAFAYHSLK